MKTCSNLVLTTILGAAALVFTPAALRAGSVLTLNVTSSTNAVWDLSTVEPLRIVDMEVSDLDSHLEGPVDFTQDGAGKLKGAGTAEFYVYSPIYEGPMTVTYKVTGGIASKGGVAKVTYNATLKGSLPYNGSVYTVSASAKRSVIVNAPTSYITGVAMDKLSAGPYKGTETTQLSDSVGIVPGLGTGAWTLTLNLDDAGTGGTATVVLNSGTRFDFTVKGSIKAGKANLSLAPSLTSPGSKGSSLKVVIDTATSTIQSLKGKLAGQTVLY
jgi:hypothetical protein